MQRLTAEYNLELTDWLIVKCAEDEPLTFTASIDGFDVEIAIKSGRSFATKKKHAKHFSRSYNRILLTVSRPETESPPPISESRDGGRDYTVQAPYFQSRIPQYANVAATILERLLLFFRHRLHQPVPARIRATDTILRNPIWKDENGELAGKGPVTIVLEAIPGIGPRHYGVLPFRKMHTAPLERALRKPITPSLAEEFLADAQTSACDGKIRRAVLEMAIAGEVATKHRFFGQSSAAALTFEFLEDKGAVKTRVIDLIHSAAMQVFGRSFRDEYPDEYDRIECLFRCRNKVAHRGNARFRDKHGVESDVTESMLEEWWIALTTLFAWLRTLKTS